MFMEGPSLWNGWVYYRPVGRKMQRKFLERGRFYLKLCRVVEIPARHKASTMSSIQAKSLLLSSSNISRIHCSVRMASFPMTGFKKSVQCTPSNITIARRPKSFYAISFSTSYIIHFSFGQLLTELYHAFEI